MVEAVQARSVARAWLAHRDFTQKRRGRRGGAAGWLQGTTVAAAITALLTRVLGQLWTAGYSLGQASAAELLGQAEVAADQEAIDQLIDTAAGQIPAMTETRLDEIAEALDDAGPDATVDSLETSITDVIANVARSLLLTQTEITWSMAEGMLGWFYGAGVRTVGWLTAEDDRVCPRCSANEAQGWIPVGDDFPSGESQPPAHPSCRCALIPGDIAGRPLPVAWPR